MARRVPDDAAVIEPSDGLRLTPEPGWDIDLSKASIGT